MLQAVIAKEVRDILSSAKFLSAFSVCAFLIVVAFYAGASNYLSSVERYEAARAENLRRFEGVTQWFNVQQNRIMMPPEPLAALVSGVSNDVGRLVDVEPRGELAAYGSRFNEEPVFAVFRFLDLEFIFLVVLSLFAILLCYDGVSGEKEGGTLRLALANQIPRSTFILGKLIGAGGTLTVALLGAMAIGVTLLPIMGVPMSGDDWVRLLLIIVCGILYFGVFLTLSLLVSSLTHRSASSFLILLVIWIVVVSILPRASVLLAGRAVDVPSVDQTSYEKAAFASSLWADFRDELAGYQGTKTDDIEAMMHAFNAYMDSLSQARDQKMSDYAGRINENRYNRQVVQQQVAFGLARLSPAASLSLATASLAGTSLAMKDRFRDDANQYQKAFASFLKEKTGMDMGGRVIVMLSDDAQPEEEIDASEIPVFQSSRRELAGSIGAAAIDIGLLAMFNLLFFAASFVAFGRYDAR